MKKYRVIAERVVLETVEVEAESEAQALEKAAEADNSAWATGHDKSWDIVAASLIE